MTRHEVKEEEQIISAWTLIIQTQRFGYVQLLLRPELVGVAALLLPAVLRTGREARVAPNRVHKFF